MKKWFRSRLGYSMDMLITAFNRLETEGISGEDFKLVEYNPSSDSVQIFYIYYKHSSELTNF